MYSSRLPSTNSLRAFESAARYLTCSGAAEELCLTQSAVSKQIKCLEASLGYAVFDRRAHGLQLTTAGANYLQIARTVLQQLETAHLQQGSSPADGDVIHLRIPPSLGEKWLLPRLPRFLQKHPNASVHFVPPLDRHAGAVPDLEIRFGNGRWDGIRSRYLTGSELALVASPHLRGLSIGGYDVDAIWKCPRLVHFQAEQHWLEVANQHPDLTSWTPRTMRYGYYSVLLEAALTGLGIAVVPRVLVEESLRSRLLLEPLALTTNSSLGYHLIDSPSRRVSALAGQLADWLFRDVTDALSASHSAIH